MDGFADVEQGRLLAAFVACLRSRTFKSIPGVGDVRQHLAKAEIGAVQFEAEQKWKRLLDFIRCCYSPDLPGCVSRGAPRITERTDHAIRAAGGLAWLNECDGAALVWCKKAFVEAYIRWNELDKGQFLLPDGPVKEAFAAIAERKQLPKDSERAQRYKLLAEQAQQIKAKHAEPVSSLVEETAAS
jgi:hypothetical protein